MLKLDYEHNNYKYFAEFDLNTESFNFKIIPQDNHLTKEYLVKYYAFDQKNINAFISNYLFSAHPDKLNDKYDCTGDLIDFSKLNKEFFIQRLITDTNYYTIQEFNALWESDNKWVLLKDISNYERTRLFMKFGIISLSEKDMDTLLWSYYSQNSGFAVKFNIDLLPKSFIGPFPINYSSKLSKITYTDINSPLCLLFQTNVKELIWQHECEWRYITFNPKGHYHPDFGSKDINSRKFYYDKSAINEIILGYNFFNIKELSRQKDFDLVFLRQPKGKGKNEKKLKRKLLSYISKESIACSQIVRTNDKYELSKVAVNIEQISCNRFKIIKENEE